MNKRIAISTIGTLGDVLPYIALSVELKKHGFDVVLGASVDFEEIITSYNIEFFNLAYSIKSFLTQPIFEKVMGKNMLTNLPAILAQGQDIVELAGRKSWEMSQGADAIIVNINTSFGIDIAEARNIPVIMSALQPLNDTGEYPFFVVPGTDLGDMLNRLTYTMTNVLQAYYDFPRNRLRKQLMGLKSRKKGGLFKDSEGNNLPTIYAYSEHVSPRPHDWPDSAKITGFWRLKDQTNWQPSKEFMNFLQAGDKPLYIGFGSMPFGTKKNTQILVKAVQMWGGRAVISKGWGGIDISNLPPEIYAIEQAPHDKLFPYMAGAVHHGGAGTTSAGLHAALPTFILPQTYDQPFWGYRVYELGCGPKPISLHKITPKILSNALRDLQDNQNYKDNVTKLAKKLNKENGTLSAVKYIKEIIKTY